MNPFLIIVVCLKLMYLTEMVVVAQSLCQNMGRFNLATNSCSCFPGYSGSQCQYVDCTKQSQSCANYTKSLCLYSTIEAYCPQLCNNPICTCGFNGCLNGGTFNPSNCSCLCPDGFFGTTCESTNPTTASVCLPVEQYRCLNQGAFNNQTCRCNCFPGYTGEYCESLTCAIQDPSTCLGYSENMCELGLVKAYCPHLCGVCPSMSTLPALPNPNLEEVTIAPPCNKNLNCQNSGVFSNATCACQCFPGYAGELCEKLNCPSVQDPPQCVNYTQSECVLRLVHNFCPNLCGRCHKIETSTGVTNTGAGVEATASPSCPFLQCQGGFFSNVTCACQCYPNWSGALCDQLVCDSSVQPASCSNYSQSYCVYKNFYEYCPLLCGACESQLNGQTTHQPVEAATTSNPCFNGGTPTPSGGCSCYPNYSGTHCESLVCKADSPTCANLPLVLCSSDPPSVEFLCPNLCGKCAAKGTEAVPLATEAVTVVAKEQTSVLAQTTSAATQAAAAAATTQSPTTAVLTTPCTPVSSCFNGGKLDPKKPCQCECYPGFTGPMCELLNCGMSDPADCSTLNLTPTQCASSYIFSSSCPFKCGLCTAATANQQVNTLALAGPVTASPTCVTLRCAPGVIFNPVTCMCPCPTGFIDDVCSLFDCDLGDKDSDECSGIDCSVPGSNIFCPQTCFNCPNPIA